MKGTCLFCVCMYINSFLETFLESFFFPIICTSLFVAIGIRYKQWNCYGKAHLSHLNLTTLQYYDEFPILLECI